MFSFTQHFGGRRRYILKKKQEQKGKKKNTPSESKLEFSVLVSVCSLMTFHIVGRKIISAKLDFVSRSYTACTTKALATFSCKHLVQLHLHIFFPLK